VQPISRVLVAHVTNLTPPGSECQPISRVLVARLTNLTTPGSECNPILGRTRCRPKPATWGWCARSTTCTTTTRRGLLCSRVRSCVCVFVYSCTASSVFSFCIQYDPRQAGLRRRGLLSSFSFYVFRRRVLRRYDEVGLCRLNQVDT
jgi:hypothetical protein